MSSPSSHGSRGSNVQVRIEMVQFILHLSLHCLTLTPSTKRGGRGDPFSLSLSLSFFLLVSNRHFLNETCAPLSYAAHPHISKRERERNRWDTPTHQKAIAREKKTSFGVRFERDAAISRLENAQKLKLENVSSV